MRFRAGKSPYKTEIYATFDRGGYVRFGADGLTAALGYYMMTSAQLERYRQAVIDDTTAPGWPNWQSGCGVMGCRSAAGRCSRPRRADVRGATPDRAPALQGPDLLAAWPVAPWLFTAGAKDRVVGFLRTAAPLHQWLDQQVGSDPA